MTTANIIHTNADLECILNTLQINMNCLMGKLLTSISIRTITDRFVKKITVINTPTI